MTKVTNSNVIIFNFEKCSFSIPPNNSSDDEYDSDDNDDYISDNDSEDDDNDDESDVDDDDDVEIFKRIDGYPNYSVSNHGNVWSDTTNKILKPGKDRKGYHTVGLHKNGKGKSHLVHRLVGIAFIANPDDKPIVDHIDGDPSNNHITNLRWASFEESAWNTKSSNPLGCKADLSYNSLN